MSLYDPSTVTIELALPEDARAIAEINRDSLINDYATDEGDDRTYIWNNKVYTWDGAGYTRAFWENRIGDEWLESKTEFYRQKIVDNKTNGVFVARFLGEVIGFAMVQDDEKEFTALYLRPNLRGMRIGRALTERVIQWTQEDGRYYQDLRLRVATFVASGVNAHLRNGFTAIGEPVPMTFAGSPEGMPSGEMILDDLTRRHEALRKKLGMAAIVASHVPILRPVHLILLLFNKTLRLMFFRSIIQPIRMPIRSMWLVSYIQKFSTRRGI